MANIAICPKIFAPPAQITPEAYDYRLTNLFLAWVMEAKRLNVEVITPISCKKLLKESFPWSEISDPVWRKYLLDWQEAIFPIVQRIAISPETKDHQAARPVSCQLNSLGQIYFDWNLCLENLSGTCPGDVGSICADPQDHSSGLYEKCEDFFIIETSEDVIKSKFPWRRIYPSTLPVGGECPFIPPQNWERHPSPLRRGDKGGFVDFFGRIWEKDQLHKTEWDVQLNDGTHLNVNYSGQIRGK